MPRNGSNYPAQLLSLITSTTYPSPPSLEGLEALQAILHAQAASTASRLAEHDPIERERLKRERKDKKRKEREDRDEGGSGGNEGGSERAMLEANERAGQRLEAVVSQRVGQFTAPPGPSKKGTPSSVKVKRERTSRESTRPDVSHEGSVRAPLRIPAMAASLPPGPFVRPLSTLSVGITCRRHPSRTSVPSPERREDTGRDGT